MISLVWWLRVVGALYVVHFVAMVIVRAPIRTFGPKDVLMSASHGEPLARFLVDSWVMFGLENGAIGVALLAASRFPDQARGLAWTVVGVELARGIIADLYMIGRRYDPKPALVWIVIHAAVIMMGVSALRR